MPSPKSGTPGQAVPPAAPKPAQEADLADPGLMAKVKVRQRQTQSGRYGSTPVTPFRRPAAGGGAADESDAPGAPPPPPPPPPGEETEQAWIEIELVGEDDKPIPGEKYRVTLPDDSVAEGTLDQNGWARVAGFDPGSCEISFPELDQAAWEFIESTGPRRPEED